MAEFERDILLRQIRQLARMIAQLVLKARAEDRYETGLEAVRAALEGGWDVDYRMLDRIDAASAALLVRDGEALRTLAWIAEQESELHRGAGDLVSARNRRCRALALYAECADRFPAEEAACRAAARALVDELDGASLPEKHRRWLEDPAAG
jgi:hypothetical protein